jgi:hypothetical protein
VLRRYVASGEALAFLGAGVSVPLYPLWAGVIGELIDAAVAQGLGRGRRPDLPGPGRGATGHGGRCVMTSPGRRPDRVAFRETPV